MKCHVRIWEEEEVACELVLSRILRIRRSSSYRAQCSRAEGRSSERAHFLAYALQIVVCPRTLGLVPSMVPVICIEFEGHIRYEDIGCIQISQLLRDTATPSGRTARWDVTPIKLTDDMRAGK